MASALPHAAPVTLLITRRIAAGRYADFLAWIRRGETLAQAYPGHLGSGVLAPPPGGDDYQIVFRFTDDASLTAWACSAERQQWLAEGADLVQQAHVAQATGIEGWFGPSAPPRWKQAVTIWLVFFPVSLLFTTFVGTHLESLPAFWRVLASTAILTPIMVFFFIPLATRALRRWLMPSAGAMPRRVG